MTATHIYILSISCLFSLSLLRRLVKLLAGHKYTDGSKPMDRLTMGMLIFWEMALSAWGWILLGIYR